MCLKVLNISDNKITSLRSLIGFRELNTLEAKNNFLNNMDDLTGTISTLTSLKELSLQDNPVTQSYRYRENLIANSILLGKIYMNLSSLLSCLLHNYHFVLWIANLDGKIVTDICRNFMKRFQMEKHNRHVKKAIKTPLGNDITSMLTIIIDLDSSSYRQKICRFSELATSFQKIYIESNFSTSWITIIYNNYS